MQIIPAIDLIDGKCVRLVKGVEGSETVFSTNPLTMAKKWEDAGASLLHVVDLDGAFQGEPKNFHMISTIASYVSIPVQVGGGIRSIETIGQYLDQGLSRVVLGTAAYNDSEFLVKACETYPEKIALSMDTKDGKVAIKGWKEVIDINTEEFLEELKSLGISMVIHTDVDRDGTMDGVSVGSIERFVRTSPIPVVASGGIASLDDIEQLSFLESSGLTGVILGRSIYTGAINLKVAIQRFS